LGLNPKSFCNAGDCSVTRNYTGLSSAYPLESTGVGFLVGLLVFLCSIAFSSSVMAGIGSQVSPAIALDTANPQLSVDELGEHPIFFASEIVPFHWVSSDHNPGTTTEHFQASLIIDETTVETISWYPDVSEFTWQCTMPEIQSGGCQIEVTAIDAFGNSTTDYTNTFTILLSLSDAPDAPAALTLGAPSPNPFNPATTVNFSAPAGNQITLSVYDARGRLVRNLANDTGGSGMVSARWDGLDNSGRPQPGGVYVFMLTAQTPEGVKRLTRKAMLIP